MSNHRSAGAFCSLVVSTVLGTSDSVQSLLLAAYGDGAEVYCAANTSVYRMDGAIVGLPSTVGDTLVQPASGNGVWVKQNFQVDLAESILGTASLHGAALSGLVVNTWQALPTGTGFYAASPVSSNFWTLDTTSGILTYIGPAGPKFLINTTFGVTNNGVVPQTLGIDFTTNGGLIGTTTDSLFASNVIFPGIAGGTVLMVHNTIVAGTPAAIYQTAFRDLALPSGSFTVDKYQVMITAL